MKSKFLTNSGNIKECCITCRNFSWWDGDYCCVPNFKILQNGDLFTEELENNMKLAKDCSDYELSEHPDFEYYIKEFYKYSELQNEIETLNKFTKDERR